MTIDDQMKFFDDWFESAWLDMNECIGKYEQTIKSMARARWLQGAINFGTDIFTRSNDSLLIEALEEAADMMNWLMGRYYETEQQINEGSSGILDSSGLSLVGQRPLCSCSQRL